MIPTLGIIFLLVTILTKVKSRLFKVEDPFAVLVIVLVFGALAIFGFFSYQKLKKKGIFAIATITEANLSKSGTRVKAIFHYDNKSYLIKFTPGFSFDVSIGRRFFIKFLPDDPMNNDQYDINVLSCIKDSLNQTWKEIPKCDE